MRDRSPLDLGSQSALFNAINCREIDSWLRPLEERAYGELASLAVGSAVSKAIKWGVGRLGSISRTGIPAQGTKVVGQSAKTQEAVVEQALKEQRQYVVYQGKNASGEVRYIGITKRKPALRFAEHLRSKTNRATLDYRVIDGYTNLTSKQAHFWEQTFINQYGLGKNGGQLYNKINSIAPGRWAEYGIK